MGTADYVAKLLKSGSVNDIFKLTGLAAAWVYSFGYQT